MMVTHAKTLLGKERLAPDQRMNPTAWSGISLLPVLILGCG
jgi:hypothetical protein